MDEVLKAQHCLRDEIPVDRGLRSFPDLVLLVSFTTIIYCSVVNHCL